MINITNLTKKYGKKPVLDDVNLKIGNGMYGLLGENGAGKSTMIKILATVLGKSGGEIEIDGIAIENVSNIRKMIGYMPQDFAFYPNYKVYEIMEYFSALSCVPIKMEKIDKILSELNLLDEKHKKVKYLSGGMKRRLGIAVAIIHSPQVLLVDEPTVGLDPQERMNFRNLLVKLAKNRTILLSTHIISDIEETCERLAILHKGKVSFAGTQKELLKTGEGYVWEYVGSPDETEAFESERDDIVIVSRRVFEGNSIIRFISEHEKGDKSKPVEARLEDCYVGVINNKMKTG